MKKFKDYTIITFGALLVAFGVYFFKFPNHFCTGGVSGISIILGSLFNRLSAGSLVLIINVLLLLVGYTLIGKEFGIKTTYGSLVLSVTTFGLEKICPLSNPLTTEPTLELILAILLTAAGSALLFQQNASTGGMDIVAMIVKKYSGCNISKALFFSDFIIVFCTFFVFGIEIWLYSMLGFITKVFFVDRAIRSLYLSKYCTVIIDPKYKEDVCKYITNEMHKTATVSESYTGAYGHDRKSVILVALTPSGANMLNQYVRSLDPHSFIIATETSEISGNGFKMAI
ncbi:MAG: YitT family protein [Acutalibacteraceae bacterium]|jgi:uncharacterized membrane-anchored protein YitT (DUF2179 family)